jgi:bacterioferritin-associated ferredoxin
MILCSCHGVPETAVDAVIARGASCLDEIASACAAGSDCGACRAYLLDKLAGCAGFAHAAAL